MTKHCELIDADEGIFRVLGMVELQLRGGLLWRTEEFEYEAGKGVNFSGFEPEGNEYKCCASLLIADGTNDPTEPGIDKVKDDDLRSVDAQLRAGIAETAEKQEMALIEWYGSYVHVLKDRRALVSNYRVREPNGCKQEVAVRTTVNGRKLIVIGWFIDGRKDGLGPSIFSIINNAVAFESDSPIRFAGVFRDMWRTPDLLGPYTGGSGDSIDNAVVVTTPSSGVGINAEYAYLGLMCGRRNVDWTLNMQALMEFGGRHFDKLSVELSGGSCRDFYFDISAFHK